MVKVATRVMGIGVLATVLTACGIMEDMEDEERVTNSVEGLHEVLNGEFMLLPQSVSDCEIVADNLGGEETPPGMWHLETGYPEHTDRVAVLGVKHIRFAEEDKLCYGTAVVETLGPKLVVFTAVTLEPNRVWCYFSGGGPEWVYHKHRKDQRSQWEAVGCDHLWNDHVADLMSSRSTSGTGVLVSS